MNASQPVQNIARGNARMLRHIGPLLWPGEWREAVARWFILSLLAAITLTAVGIYRWPIAVGLAAWILAAHQAGRSPDLDEPNEVDEQSEEWHRDDVIELLWELTGARNGVHLITVRAQLEAETGRAWTPAEVRALLADAGVPVRDGVRIKGVGNTTGVHRNDLTPLPSPASETAPVGVVAAGQDSNTNTNNSPSVKFREWGMTIITDPADQHRQHKVPRTR